MSSLLVTIIVNSISSHFNFFVYFTSNDPDWQLNWRQLV
jgi:hypothetical protein